MSQSSDNRDSTHDMLMSALADAHRAVKEARSLVADRAIASNSTLVEFEELFEEYEAAYERYRSAILRISTLGDPQTQSAPGADPANHPEG